MSPSITAAVENDGYNFAYLDEQSKRVIRRTLLKAIAIPGYQVPFRRRELPLPPGWGTGGIQVTASLLGPDDVLKVIDQGDDDATNAVTIRRFFARVAGVATTSSTAAASIIQTRHRVPETPLAEGQIVVLQVGSPDPLRRVERRVTETRKMHAFAEYSLIYVQLYEHVRRYGALGIGYGCPVVANGRYLMSPSPIPNFDVPKLQRSPALYLFGAGAGHRIYALPPYTTIEPIAFADYPFDIPDQAGVCGLCGAQDSFLDSVLIDDRGTRLHACSDTEYCRARREAARS